jgi:outer membrane protein with beta-barrel domain
MIGRSVLALSAVVLLGATTAQAEVMVTPFAGVAFGGVTERSRGTYGVALGFLGSGVTGFEAEFATTPEFFGDSATAGAFTKNNVVTLMGSVLLAVPAGPVRLYGAAGAGLMKTRIQAADVFFDVSSSDFGVNVGGGLIGYVGSHVGLRADIRYFRDLSDLNPSGDPVDVNLSLGDKVNYWRVVGGLTFKF